MWKSEAAWALLHLAVAAMWIYFACRGGASVWLCWTFGVASALAAGLRLTARIYTARNIPLPPPPGFDR